MNVTCFYDQTPFTLSMEEKIAALRKMHAENLHHYDARCPRCGRANAISRERLEMFTPGWEEAIKMPAAMPAKPAMPAASTPSMAAPAMPAPAAPMAAVKKAPARKKHASAAKKAARKGKPAAKKTAKKASKAKRPVKKAAKKSVKKAIKRANKARSRRR